jgi:hypothetical protein
MTSSGDEIFPRALSAMQTRNFDAVARLFKHPIELRPGHIPTSMSPALTRRGERCVRIGLVVYDALYNSTFG